MREFMVIECYSHVVHLVSSVEGRLRPGLDALDAFTACFPAGTLTGLPNAKPWKSSTGWSLGPAILTAAQSGIWISTGILIHASPSEPLSIIHNGETFCLQTGAGIVADSIPELEDQETLNKARVLMLAVMEAEEVQENDSNDR